MERREKVIVIFGAVNFLIFVFGMLAGIPSQIPGLLKAVGVTPYSFFEVLVQMVFTGAVYVIPGFAFTMIFFRDKTTIEKVLIAFTITAALFGIYDFIGAGPNPVFWYSIVSTHTFIFSGIFILLALIVYGIKKSMKR